MLQSRDFSRLIRRMRVWLAPAPPSISSMWAAALLALVVVAPVSRVEADTDVPRVKTVAQATRAELRRAAAEQDRERVCAPFLAWAGDGPVPYYGGFRAPPAAIAAFLRADRFVPHFGKRYEELSQAELRKLSQALGRCFHSNGPTSKIDARVRTLMGQALKPPAVGKAGYMCDYTLAVEQQLNPAFVGPEAKALLEGANLKAARFIESRKGWLMIYTDDAIR